MEKEYLGSAGSTCRSMEKEYLGSAGSNAGLWRRNI